MQKKINLYMLCLTALFTALMAAGAFIKIPIGPVPITFQVTFAILAGMLLGKKYGALSVALYVVLGLIGLPVFTKGGGIGYVMQPTFGYLLGFIGGAFVAGAVVKSVARPSLLRLIAATFAGLAVIYGVALVYVYFLSNFVLGTALGVGPLLMNYFLLFIPGDALVGVGCAFLAKRLIPALKLRTEKKPAINKK